jgi:proteasome accessory factor C
MVKRFSAPLERTARLLDLVPYIHSHQGISLKDLAHRFDVTTQQMISDLTTLWMCGLPGYTPLELMDLDFESGFVTINNAPTLSKPRSITFDEGVALLLGLDLVRSSIPGEREDLLQQIDSLAQRISSATGLSKALSATASVNADISTAITKAMESQSALSIQYHSLYRDEISLRDIFPIELIEIDSHQYLSAFCYTANDFRQFKIDRILTTRPSDLVREFSQGQADAEQIQLHVRVIAASREIAERFGQEKLTTGSDFETTSYSQQWIERSILASGSGLELVSPSNIRSSIAKRAQSMLDRYKAS